MFPLKSIETALGIKIATPPDRLTDQELWRRAERGESDWNSDSVPSIRLASSTCKEAARAATTMFESSITGSPLADYVNTQYQKSVNEIYDIAYKTCSNGKILLVPVAINGEIHTKILGTDEYFPFQYDPIIGLTGVAMMEKRKENDKYYTLLEKRTYEARAQLYIIEHWAYRSDSPDTLGVEVGLDALEEWTHLKPHVPWPAVKRPWHIEVSLRDGRPIFADGMDWIKEADKQMARIIWENEGGELAVHADTDMFRSNGEDGNFQMASLNKRLYRKVRTNSTSDGKLSMETFSPDLRTTALLEALNSFLRQYEVMVGLPRATFSDPQVQAKTAEEVKSGKPRFSDTVKNLQRILEISIKQLVEIMADIAPRYQYVRMGYIDVKDIYFFWDETTLVTKEEKRKENMEEFATLVNAVALGLKPEIPIAFLYNTSDNLSKITPEDIDKARELMGSVFTPPE